MDQVRLIVASPSVGQSLERSGRGDWGVVEAAVQGRGELSGGEEFEETDFRRRSIERDSGVGELGVG